MSQPFPSFATPQTSHGFPPPSSFPQQFPSQQFPSQQSSQQFPSPFPPQQFPPQQFPPQQSSQSTLPISHQNPFATPSSQAEVNNLQNLTYTLAQQQPSTSGFLKLENIIGSKPVTEEELTTLIANVKTSSTSATSATSSTFPIPSNVSASQPVTPVDQIGQFKNTTAEDVLNRIEEHQKSRPHYQPFIFPNGKTIAGKMIKWTKQDVPNNGQPITSLEQLSNILKQEVEETCNLPTTTMYQYDSSIPDFLKNINPVSSVDPIPQKDTDQFQFVFEEKVDIPIPSPQSIKSKIIEPYIDQRMTMFDSLRMGLPATWERLFNESIPHLKLISDILQKDEMENGTWYPLKQDLFRAFRYCPLTVPGTNIPYLKAVIIGMDPYPQCLDGNVNHPKAVGMSFSIRRDDPVIPVSLRKIFQEMELEFSSEGYRIPSHGDLTDIAVQGVLFLNKCPTFTPRFGPNEHIHLKKDFWKGFIINVINIITEVCPKAIFVMWGGDAQKLDGLIPAKMKRLVAAHPSNRQNSGFLGCGHFRIINETLISQGERPINWQT